MGEAVVEEAAKDLSRALALYASELADCEMKDYLDWAGKWTQRAKRKIYIQDAASPHVVSRGEFDRDPWLLNLNNGTLGPTDDGAAWAQPRRSDNTPCPGGL